MNSQKNLNKLQAMQITEKKPANIKATGKPLKSSMKVSTRNITILSM